MCKHMHHIPAPESKMLFLGIANSPAGSSSSPARVWEPNCCILLGGTSLPRACFDRSWNPRLQKWRTGSKPPGLYPNKDPKHPLNRPTNLVPLPVLSGFQDSSNALRLRLLPALSRVAIAKSCRCSARLSLPPKKNTYQSKGIQIAAANQTKPKQNNTKPTNNPPDSPRGPRPSWPPSRSPLGQRLPSTAAPATEDETRKIHRWIRKSKRKRGFDILMKS